MAGLLAAGMYSHESGQRLLQILLKLSERGFLGLYEKCKGQCDMPYYQTGLTRVAEWSDDVIQEDVDFIVEQCPDFEETFNECFTIYLQDRFRGKRVKHPSPQTHEFVRKYLLHLGQHDTLKTGSYFGTKDPVTMRVACMDASRQALYALITSENVEVELASEVAFPNAEEVSPDDSVSQIGMSHIPHAPQQAPSSTSSRHDFAPAPTPARTRPTTALSSTTPADFPHEQFEIVPKRPPSVVSAASLAQTRQVASSRDSSVSIGMKKPKSPRG